MKRIICLMMCLVIAAVSVSGCAGGAKDPVDVPSAEAQTQPETESAEPPDTASETEATDAPETAPETTTASEATTVPETEPATETTLPETEAPETTAPETAAPETEPPQTTTAASISVEAVSKTMYAKDNVNVRTGPGTSYDIAGYLKKGTAVEVTGLAENGWYRIKFMDGEYFVSGSYLENEKPAAETSAAVTTAAETAAPKTEPAPATEAPEPVKVEKTKWIATWGTAMLVAGADQTPTKPALENNTVRQQIRVSVGGETIRLQISNEFGKSDLKIESIKIAKIKGVTKPDIDLDTEKVLTVGGKSSFTIGAGKKVTTDELEFEVEDLDNLAITMKLGSVPNVLTCHTASRCSTWVVKGDHVSDNSYSGNQEMTAWYFISELDVLAEEDAQVVVCLGDSLTDGASVTTNAFSRYTDELARQLNKDENLSNIAVVNRGIGATALYTYGNDSGKNRFQRDVLDTPGVKYLVLLYGVNDIGGAQNDISSNIINEYKSMIKKAHDKGIIVFGCTLTPFKGNSYYSDLHERIRLKVNEFVMSKDSGFDAYIDLSSAVASKDDPAKMDRKYVSVWNDYLHFNDSGYKFVGKTVYQAMKDYIEK